MLNVSSFRIKTTATPSLLQINYLTIFTISDLSHMLFWIKNVMCNQRTWRKLKNHHVVLLFFDDTFCTLFLISLVEKSSK